MARRRDCPRRLRELPSSGAPSPKSWAYYTRAVREWMEFLGAQGVGMFDSRDRLQLALGKVRLLPQLPP